MAFSVQTTPTRLVQLVQWAHSHGTICTLIPSLRHRSHAPLTSDPSNTPVAVWGCSAGHAYHWPLGYCDNRSSKRAGNNMEQDSDTQATKGSRTVSVRRSCDLSCSEPASEGEEFPSQLFDMAGCDSSATDDDGDYEPHASRKRGVAEGGAKRIKQEATTADDYFLLAQDTGGGAQASQPSPSPLERDVLGCEATPHPHVEALGGDQAPPTSPPTERAVTGLCELQCVTELLRVERRRAEELQEEVSSLRQDKEVLQRDIREKERLICGFLQEKKRPHSSNQMEAGSSHVAFPDDVAAFDSPVLFDSFEEAELHSLERQRGLKSKRSRDGENTRVRMKNVVGVIARYMAALQEFRRSVSMKVAFDRVGVDRNTISRTAAIAELSLAAPEVFRALAPWDEKEETLAHYAHRCRQAMDEPIRAKIKSMKTKGELLPIVSK